MSAERDAERRAQAAEFELRTLRELAAEFATSFDPRGVASVALASLMGHLTFPRGAFAVSMSEGPNPGNPPAGPTCLLASRGVRDKDAQDLLRAFDGKGTTVSCEALHAARLARVFTVAVGEDRAHILASARVSGSDFSGDDAALVEAVARQALTAIAALRAHELRVQKAQVDAEFRVAREIQQSLLPARLPVIPGFDLAARSEPCLAVGGDLYDVLPLDDTRHALVVADVSGKGAPASLIMAFTHAAFRSLAGGDPPARLMARISELIRSSNRMHRYVTCFYAELNHARGTLTYVNAGHPAPILVGRGPRRARLARGGAVLGLLPNTTFDSETIALEPGDALAIFSDGVSEAMSPAEVEFGDTGVERVLVSAAGETAPDTLSRLEDALERFCDGRAFGDDRTAVILRAHD